MSNRQAPSARSRRIHWRAAALGGAIAAFTVCATAIPAMAVGNAAPQAAAAQPAASCNAMVADTTPGHVLGDDSAVTKAAAQLEAKGADVRVRVLPSAPDGSLDAYEAAEIAACPSWALNGAIKPNLLVFLVSLDHQDAVFYGSNFSRLQGHVDQVRADMGSDFEAGQFAAGTTKGESETYSALYPSGMPALEIFLIVAVIAIALFGLVILLAKGGSGYGGGYSSNTVIIGGGGFGGGGGGFSGGGSSGGSSGSW